MYIQDIKLIGYGGIFNGLGKKELYIELGKGSFIIIGDNGSGKTSLKNALSPIPDNNSCFVKGEYAEKLLHIVDEDIIYEIRCVHSIDKKGNRETAKIYFHKTDIEGNVVDLNPNGNVNSYKESLYSEFTLDANFLALSSLSSTEKGIGVLTSSERKKHVNSVVATLSDYNDIYKALTKRSNIFKSMVNNIVTKINNIGDEEKLELTLKSLEDRLNSFISEKESVNRELAVHQSKIQLLDPTNNIQDSYNRILNDMNIINNKITNISSDIEKSLVDNFKLPKNTTFEQLVKFNNEINDNYTTLDVQIKIDESSILNLINNRENESKQLQDKIAKLDSIKIGIDSSSSILNNINILKKSISEKQHQLSELDIDPNIDMSKEEFILGIETLNNIKDTILGYKTDKDYGLLEEASNYVKNNLVLPDDITLNMNITVLQNKIQEINIEYNKYSAMQETLDVLNNRPENCNVPSCPFIKTALTNKGILDNIDLDEMENNIKDLNNTLNKMIDNRNHYTELRVYVNVINNIIRDIKSHSFILNKLPVDINNFLDLDNLISMIIGGYQFPEIQILYDNIQISDLINIIKDEKNKLEELTKEYKLHENKYILIEEISKQIDEMNEKIEGICKNIEDKQNEILENKKQLTVYNTMKMCFNTIFNMYTEKKKLEDEKQKLISSYNAIRNDMLIINQSMQEVSKLSDKLDYIDKQITPIMNDRDDIRFSLGQLKEYKVELESFNNKYQKVETIKHYCSPSKDGIQNVFIELYMNTTLQMTNQILSLLFGGKYVIPQFIINEKEFRIPVYGNGLPNDDVSSMSNAQVSMISMIISFVMLKQSSSKYNIISLDEIDSMLDTPNRLQFAFVINKIKSILGIEQLFLISHNTEMDLSEFKVILLNCNEYEKYNDCNVIYNNNL